MKHNSQNEISERLGGGYNAQNGQLKYRRETMWVGGQECKLRTKSERRSDRARYQVSMLETGNGEFREEAKVEERRKQEQNPRSGHVR